MEQQEVFNKHLESLRRQSQGGNWSLEFFKEYLDIIGKTPAEYKFKCKECIAYDRSHATCDIDGSAVTPDKGRCRLFYFYESL